jgi:hypothetical protein
MKTKSGDSMKMKDAEEKIRESIIEIRKLFTNKKWCRWADAWLSGADRSVASAELVAKEMGRHAPKSTSSGQPSSPSAMLKSPAQNAALAAAIVARSADEEIDPFASLMLEGYLKKDDSAGDKKNKKPRKAGGE